MQSEMEQSSANTEAVALAHAWLRPGDDVQLHGLLATAYNGRRARLEEWDNEKQRWSVVLLREDDDEGAAFGEVPDNGGGGGLAGYIMVSTGGE